MALRSGIDGFRSSISQEAGSLWFARLAMLARRFSCGKACWRTRAARQGRRHSNASAAGGARVRGSGGPAGVCAHAACRPVVLACGRHPPENRQDGDGPFAGITRAVPREWAQKQKLGFPVPLASWLREDRYFNKIGEAFSSTEAAEFFDSDALMRLLEEHRSGATDNSRRIWIVYSFLVWYRVFFIEDDTLPQR